MKKTLTTFFSLLIGALLLSSCEKCGNPVITEPTAADSEWLVYARKDSAIFVDEDGLRVKYTATDSVSNKVAGEGLSPDENCFDKLDSQNIVILKDAGNTLPDLATFIYKTPSKLQVRLAVEQSEGKNLSIETPTYTTKEINGVSYSNVYEVNFQKVKAYSAKQILFNKEFGFLRLELHDGRYIERKL